MKIVLIQDLNVEENLIIDYKNKIENMGHKFEYFLDEQIDEKNILDRTKDADIIMIANSRLKDEHIKYMKNLKYINVAFTGVDHLDKEEIQKRNIVVTNVKSYSDICVSELIIGLTISLMRDIKNMDIKIRKQKTHEGFKGSEIRGKNVAIIGMGNIGFETAKLFEAFGANIYYYSRNEKEYAKNRGYIYKSFKEVLKLADIVSVNLPLTRETKNFFGKEEFDLMKKEAVFINCARGPIVNEDDLIDALEKGKIKAAGVDVFDKEPPLKKDDKILKCKNLILTPHIAYFTKESMQRRAHIVFDNLIAYLNGQIKNSVDLK